MTDFHLWDAVVAWRDHIYQADLFNNTKSNYLTGMLKLIESGFVDIRLNLDKVDETWAKESKQKIDDNQKWSAATKTIRKSCLNSLYKFIKNDFDYGILPYRRHPKPNEINHILSVREEQALLKHLLSSVQDKALTVDISPEVLCNALSKINERDAYIVWLMMWTGQALEKILDRRKENLKTSYIDRENLGASYMAYLDFSDNSKYEYIPPHITDGINELCKNSKVYLFETANGKRIRRTQVTRNLKQAGHNIGLDFDLTPKVLHGYVNAYMSRDKRSELEKTFFS